MITIPKAYFNLFLLVFAFHFGLGQEYEKRLATLEDKAYEHFYTNKDSTYFYFNQINALALDNDQIVTAIDNLNYVCFAAGYFYDLDKIKTTIESIEQLVKNHPKALDTRTDGGEFQKNYLNFNKGNYYHKLEDFAKATFYFDLIAKQISSNPNYQDNLDKLTLLSQCYNFIAQMNTMEKKFETGNDYYEKNIRLFKTYMPEDLEGLYKVYNLYANSLYREGNNEKAKKLWSASLNYNEKNYSERNRNSIVTTALLLSKVYSDLNKIDSATHYLNKINTYKIQDDPFMDRYRIAKGEIHLKENKLPEALEAFQSAFKTSLDGDKPQLKKKVGDLFLKMTDSIKALDSYQKGMILLGSEFDAISLANNPDPKTIKQKNTLISLLAAKASTLSNFPDSISKISALNSVNTGLKTLDLLKPTFKNQTDKLGLIEDAFMLFETGMKTGYELHKKYLEGNYIDAVFKYSEKSKSAILLDALLNSKATEFSNIPGSLIEKEKQLKTQISHFEKELFESESNANEKSDAIFALRQEHTSLIEIFETSYPSYYKLRYDTKVTSIESLQKMLLEDDVFISFFYGDEAIYAISITPKNKRIITISTSPKLDSELREVHEMLGNPKSKIEDLSKKSHYIYQTLMHPIIGDIDVKNIIIVPDGLLNYIPFGALNTKENGLSYLMESHAISYANSATLFVELKNRKKVEGELLAIAPEFSGEQVQVNPSRDNLLPLPHNKREVEQILQSFSGKSFINTNASLANFTSELSKYGLLHLATHAVFDDTAPEYSYLAFSSVPDQENLLYVSDLYNLQINADLVTLSACESGIGELKRGEGFLSLARGFFYSGASSIASTLWKINDASTTSLMDSFYKNLADGNAKDIALQKAKKTFLESNRQNGLSHPYYWSGFIISGNTQPLLTKPRYWLWIGIGLVIIGMVGWLVYKRKSKINSIPSKG